MDSELIQGFEADFDRQRTFFESGGTQSLEARQNGLKQLKKGVQKYEEKILAALAADLGRPYAESFSSEIGVLYSEIGHALKHLRKWMKARRAPTPMILFPARSRIVSVPKGQTLIIGPWNYPFQLLMTPLVGAISAGCTATLKPSEYATKTAKVVEELISECMDPQWVSVVQGEGRQVIPAMMKSRRFDHLFFTGSTGTGKAIAKAAAEYLTPTTLELGGKSPALIDISANLKSAARKIVWGKYFNAGQTCVAPDYVVLHSSQKSAFLNLVRENLIRFFGKEIEKSKSYARIIHAQHFDQLAKLLEDTKVLIGGSHDRESLYFEPTVIEATLDHPSMQEEIFGPVLPVLTYNDTSEMFEIVKQNPQPLSLYLFTTDRKLELKMIKQVQFGGGCINEVIAHLANPELPFGGIGNSGSGRYHGKYSFDEFSHEKSILKSSSWFDLPFRYPPYTESTLKILRKLFR